MNQRIIKNTLYLYLRMLFSMGVSLYTSRVVLATLGVEDFGIYTVVGGVVIMFSFINASMSEGATRFLTFALGKGNMEEFRKTFSAALTIHILIAFVILIFAETIGLWYMENKMVIPAERMNAARVVFHLSIISTMATIIQAPYNATIIAHERMNIYAFIEILNVCLKLGIVFLLVVGHWDKLILYAILVLAVAFLIAGTYRQYCIKHFKECRYQLEWDKKIIHPMLTFSGWEIVGCGAYVGSTQGVNQLLNLFFGAVVNAAYGAASWVTSAITGFVRNFQMAVNPQIVKLYAAEKIDELYSLLFQNAKFSFSLMWLLLLPASLTMETILQIWLVEVPEHTALFCRLALIQSLVACLQRPFVTAIHATGRMKVFQMSSGTILLSALPVSYFYLKAGGAPYIPFVVFICAAVLELCVEVYLLKRWINLSLIRLIKTVLVPVLLIIACTLPPSLIVNQYLPFLLSAMFSGLTVCISVYFIAFNKETKAKIHNQIRNVFHQIVKKSNI